VKFSAVILAAGKGVRMRSELPKVVHQVAGKPMVLYVTDAVRDVGASRIVLVVGHGRHEVEKLFSAGEAEFVVQEEQLGTGHALQQARPNIENDETIMVLAGDTPLLQPSTLRALLAEHQRQGTAATVLSTMVDNPYGYGRIIKNNLGEFQAIVEEKDADSNQKKICEINSGMYCFQVQPCLKALENLNSDNAQGEYYITQVLTNLVQAGHKINVVCLDASQDIYGVNDRVQLAQAGDVLRQRKNDELMRAGVTIIDPSATYIDFQVSIGSDTVIYPGTFIEGSTSIGQECEIGPGTHITSALIGNQVFIEHSRIKEAQIGDECTIGPYAYLRPGAVLHRKVKVGDFAEIKKSVIGEGSKIPHLSYVGDATIGKGVNIGAGTITCNYDGVNKWETVLEDGVFIGSNTNLVAPIKIGANSVTGAGSTLSRDVPANTLAVERASAKHIKKRPPKSTE